MTRSIVPSVKAATGWSSPASLPRVTGRIAPGSNGAGLARRVYRQSPIRHLRTITIAHRGLTADDVFLASYPRSGSVWLRFLLTEMLSGDASFVTIARTVPYVGKHRATPRLVPGGGRMIKTHEPFMSRYRRAIHLVRDPRDVCISYFNFLQRIGKITIRGGDDEAASFDHHVDAFLAGRVDAFGTWQQHVTVVVGGEGATVWPTFTGSGSRISRRTRRPSSSDLPTGWRFPSAGAMPSESPSAARSRT